MARSAERHAEKRREDPQECSDKVPVERNTEHVRAAAVVPCSSTCFVHARSTVTVAPIDFRLEPTVITTSRSHRAL